MKPMQKKFKVHMIRYQDDDLYIATMCGIGTYSRKRSEDFLDNAKSVSFGDVRNTTCASCLKSYQVADREFFKHKQRVSTDKFTECLKECNVKLATLKPSKYSFVAWVTYSVEQACFIAGIDAYDKHTENLNFVVAKSADVYLFEAINLIRVQINKWDEEGWIPLDVLSEDNSTLLTR